MTKNNDSTVRLSVKQDLTVGNVTEMLDSCERVLADNPAGAVALDLCGASFVDSIGTSAVIQLYKQCQGQGRSFSVEVDSAQLRRIFQHSGLDALLEEHKNDFVVLASHYPMLTGGPHGGLTYGFFLDLIVTPLGWMMGGLGNTYEAGYADWIARTQDVLRRNPPDVYAAGHDHSLQLLDSADVAGIYIVSGAGSRDRVSTVTDLPETFFAHAAPGFIVVDFGASEGRDAVVIRVVEPDVAEPVFEMELE